MQPSQDRAFDIDEARRVLVDVFAPWVKDLGLSVESVDHDPPADPPADWQPGAVLRMPFSERLCRHGGKPPGQLARRLGELLGVEGQAGRSGRGTGSRLQGAILLRVPPVYAAAAHYTGEQFDQAD